MELKKVDEVVKVSIGESLSDLVSGFGRYQVWQSFLALVPVVCTAMSNTNFVFAAAAVDYRYLLELNINLLNCRSLKLSLSLPALIILPITKSILPENKFNINIKNNLIV